MNRLAHAFRSSSAPLNRQRLSEEQAGPDTEGFGKGDEVVDRDVGGCLLDALHQPEFEIALLGQIGLRPRAFTPQTADVGGERFEGLNRGVAHPLGLPADRSKKNDIYGHLPLRAVGATGSIGVGGV